MQLFYIIIISRMFISQYERITRYECIVTLTMGHILVKPGAPAKGWRAPGFFVHEVGVSVCPRPRGYKLYSRDI